LHIRYADKREAKALTSLCMRSKAHWGYDAEFMRDAAPALLITEAMIRKRFVLVAEDHNGDVLGVAAIEPVGAEGAYDLSRLFVQPSAMRTGVGRSLFAVAVAVIQQRGGRSLSILSDPFAVAFYQRLGAIRVGDAPSDAISGRLLPLLEYRIPCV
jgi:predicted N-acetyltransferase YhbS